MFLVDTNILIYAADSSSSAHPIYKALLDQWRRESTPWYLTWSIIYEFLRVTTHPRVFRKPWNLKEAWEFIEILLESQSVSVLTEGEQHRKHLAEIVENPRELRGNLLHDAHIVALMKEHGIHTIYTRDTDFHKFPNLKVKDPYTDLRAE